MGCFRVAAICVICAVPPAVGQESATEQVVIPELDQEYFSEVEAYKKWLLQNELPDLGIEEQAIGQSRGLFLSPQAPSAAEDAYQPGSIFATEKNKGINTRRLEINNTLDTARP